MKVPTRRWGNFERNVIRERQADGLNESPHPKVGKCFSMRP